MYVCVVCLSLGSYLVEWLEYHMLIGVEFFYVISQDCPEADSAATVLVLQPYINSDIVFLDRAYQVCVFVCVCVCVCVSVCVCVCMRALVCVYVLSGFLL